MDNSTFFDYSLTNNKYTAISDSGIYNNYNYSVFRPFNNYSFLALSYNQINLINILNTTSGFSLQESFGYYITEGNNLDQNNHNNLDAFSIAGNNYYIYSDVNHFGSYEMIVQDIHSSPIDFQPITSSSSVSTNQNYYSYTSFTSTSSTSGSDFFNFIAIIVIGLIIFASIGVYLNQRNNSNRYYEPIDKSYLSRSNNYTNVNAKSDQSMNKAKFCFNCGSTVSPDDVFCQNCGNKL